ncbi:hypothetical protein LguiB_020809 [Lonicera macranthoides]
MENNKSVLLQEAWLFQCTSCCHFASISDKILFLRNSFLLHACVVVIPHITYSSM